MTNSIPLSPDHLTKCSSVPSVITFPSPFLVQRERPSLSDLPIKRTSTDSSINPSKPKRRRRKPSSSNESTTSEAPSNSSDFSLIPVIPSSSPHLAPGLPPLSLPGVAKDHLEGGRVQKGRPPRHEEVVQMMEVRGDNFSASAMAVSLCVPLCVRACICVCACICVVHAVRERVSWQQGILGS